jgi:hypothetical protein
MNPTSEVFGRPKEIHSLRVSVIKYVWQCESKREKCSNAARIQIEIRSASGAPSRIHDLCHEHAAPVLEKAKAAGLTIIDD